MSLLEPFASAARMPGKNQRVYKDECYFSFDSPKSPEGLFVCMKAFLGFGRKYVEAYSARTGNRLFLHIRQVPRAASVEPASDEVPEKIVRLAIGVEGGFRADVNKVEYDEEYKIMLLPEFSSFEIDDNAVPLAISMSAKALISCKSATKQMQLAETAAAWEGEPLIESKFAKDLLQLDTKVSVPSEAWKCQWCDLTTNLWLNLTDGSVLCGRRFFDGSGGNNHALEHYQTHQYPLAVKLGTITADGQADVFSYAEDRMVSDPFLKEHLAHFGINMSHLVKTEKSMEELEIEMNQKFDEWAKLTESGSTLVPVYGPGFTGMHNLGNTCYMNSVMQVLFSLPPFVAAYVSKADDVFSKVDFAHDPVDNCLLQMAKLGRGLCSGDYSVPTKDKDDADHGIRPVLFKQMIGKGHAEFSGKQQQDAQEFFLHLLSVLERNNQKHQLPNCFAGLQFEVEDRLQCGVTGQVRYLSRVEDYLPLAIPVECAVNQEQVNDYKRLKQEKERNGQTIEPSSIVRPRIPFQACLEKFCLEEVIEDFYSPAAKSVTTACKTMRLKTFPDYLLIQLKKFAVDESLVPYKLDVEVDMPDEIDFACLRAKGGLQEGETEMPNDSKPVAGGIPSLVPDADIVNQLMEMGFSLEGCRKAAFNTKNSGVEAAMNWIMAHMNDEDFNAPLDSATLPKTAFVPDANGLAMLMDMSFSKAQATRALRETDNNVERAVDWIFNHPDQTDVPATADATSPCHPKASLTDGGTEYFLRAFISHMGQSHMVGHYVCHILKDGQWVIFNDSKVALSEKPPKELAYLYVYERKNG